jgi:predicted ATPase
MKFGIKNLGPIKEANIEIGDLTIICGKNNTGKTYLTYALSTFLDTISRNLFIPLEDQQKC